MEAKRDIDNTVQLMEHLNVMPKTGDRTDVTLVCGEDRIEIPAHQIKLTSSSIFFRTMFLSEWKENKSGKVELPSVGAEEMKMILLYLYGSEFKEVEDRILLEKMFKASHLFQINALVEWCYDKLAAGISTNDFLNIYNMAEMCGKEGALTEVLTFLVAHFRVIIDSDDFLKLSEQQMKNILDLLGPVEPSMDVVMKGLLQWAEVKKDREEFLLQVVKTLDLQLLSTEFLKQILRKESVVKSNYHLLLLLNTEATIRTLPDDDVSEVSYSSMTLR